MVGIPTVARPASNQAFARSPMIEPMTLTERLLFTTVRIQTRTASGTTGTGTGFFFTFAATSRPGANIPVVVTNKHVVAGAVAGTFTVHEMADGKPSGRFYPVDLDAFERLWIPHPDPDVDLCAMLAGPIYEAARNSGRPVYHLDLSKEVIASQQQLDSLSAVEDVLMVGYPNGLWDEFNNFPILRRGITATHPAVQFNGKPHGVIDMACFPGSSGSPVLLVNETSWRARNGDICFGDRSILLGVLFAGPRAVASGNFVVQPIPTSATPQVQVSVMVHLGYYIKAAELAVLGERVNRVLTESGAI